jgi:hypothetical protein
MTPPKSYMVAKKLSYDFNNVDVDTPRKTRSDKTEEKAPQEVSPPTSGVDLLGLDPRRLFPEIDEYCLDDELSIASDDTDLVGDMQETEKHEKFVEPDAVILDKQLFLKFLCATFRCTGCKEAVTKDDFKFHTRGIATSINYLCNRCFKTTACKSKKTKILDTSKTSTHHARDSKWDYPQEALDLALYDYDLNTKFIMAMQAIGHGGSAAAVVASFLGLRTGGFNRKWTMMEESIARNQISLCAKIIEENLEAEMKASPERMDDKTGVMRALLQVMMDCGWIKRGRSYDSAQGHHMTIGALTKKVIALTVFNKVCIKCERGECFDKVHCANPTKYGGSSKGMEGAGAGIAARKIIRKGAFIGTFISDDDSSQRSLVKRKLKDLFAHGDIKKEDLYTVTKKSKRKKTDVGVLPYENGPVVHLADPNHRVKSFGNKIYEYVNMGVKKSECEKSDAERLKRNLSFCIRTNVQKTFDEFKTAMNAVLEHHFDCHEYCDAEWCAHLREDDGKKRYYRCKKKNKKLYEQLRTVTEKFFTDERLKEIYHKFNTNKCENLMSIVTSYCPKTRHYSGTINGKGRICLGVTVDSLGYVETYRSLFALTGSTFDGPVVEQLRRMDRRREVMQLYKVTPKFRARRARLRAMKIQLESQKTAKDNRIGHSYESCMAVEEEKTPTTKGKKKKTPGKKPTKKTSPRKVVCRDCRRFGHDTRDNPKCVKFEEMINEAAGITATYLDNLDCLPFDQCGTSAGDGDVDPKVGDGSDKVRKKKTKKTVRSRKSVPVPSNP